MPAGGGETHMSIKIPEMNSLANSLNKINDKQHTHLLSEETAKYFHSASHQVTAYKINSKQPLGDD